MQNKRNYTHVVWDFNGTILDDVQLGIDCVNTMLAKRGLPTLPDKNAYRRVFGFPIEAYYRRLGFDFEKEDYNTVLAPEWVELYSAGEPACLLNPGVTETIATLQSRGVPQIILSASDRNQLLGQLARLGLHDAFDEVLGLDNIHARSKTLLAIEWKQQNPDACPLFVGDRDHDADVATAIDADCLLYLGGHQPEEILAGCGVPLISEISQLLDFL